MVGRASSKLGRHLCIDKLPGLAVSSYRRDALGSPDSPQPLPQRLPQNSVVAGPMTDKLGIGPPLDPVPPVPDTSPSAQGSSLSPVRALPDSAFPAVPAWFAQSSDASDRKPCYCIFLGRDECADQVRDGGRSGQRLPRVGTGVEFCRLPKP